MIFHTRSLTLTFIMGLTLNALFSSTGFAQYQRCWLEKGIMTINCAPADGYSFKKDNNLYKKCPVLSGKIQKSCKIEDGYTLSYKNYRWYQCPVQQGKLSDYCTLASGYQIVKIHHSIFRN